MQFPLTSLSRKEPPPDLDDGYNRRLEREVARWRSKGVGGVAGGRGVKRQLRLYRLLRLGCHRFLRHLSAFEEYHLSRAAINGAYDATGVVASTFGIEPFDMWCKSTKCLEFLGKALHCDFAYTRKSLVCLKSRFLVKLLVKIFRAGSEICFCPVLEIVAHILAMLADDNILHRRQWLD